MPISNVVPATIKFKADNDINHDQNPVMNDYVQAWTDPDHLL